MAPIRLKNALTGFKKHHEFTYEILISISFKK